MSDERLLRKAGGVLVDRLQPVLLSSSGASSWVSQDRKHCGLATAHRQECLCHWKRSRTGVVFVTAYRRGLCL
jgi:hypothetical protein